VEGETEIQNGKSWKQVGRSRPSRRPGISVETLPRQRTGRSSGFWVHFWRLGSKNTCRSSKEALLMEKPVYQVVRPVWETKRNTLQKEKPVCLKDGQKSRNSSGKKTATLR